MNAETKNAFSPKIEDEEVVRGIYENSKALDVTKTEYVIEAVKHYNAIVKSVYGKLCETVSQPVITEQIPSAVETAQPKNNAKKTKPTKWTSGTMVTYCGEYRPEYTGQTKTLKEWATEIGRPTETLVARANRGLPPTDDGIFRQGDFPRGRKSFTERG